MTLTVLLLMGLHRLLLRLQLALLAAFGAMLAAAAYAAAVWTAVLP